MIGHAIPVYKGYASQYGHGLGNVLGGIVRSALPIVSNIAKSAGKELLRSGLNYVSKKIKKRKSSRNKRIHQVKRSSSRLRKANKKHMPPGKPAKKHKGKGKSTGRDIFT